MKKLLTLSLTLSINHYSQCSYLNIPDVLTICSGAQITSLNMYIWVIALVFKEQFIHHCLRTGGLHHF